MIRLVGRVLLLLGVWWLAAPVRAQPQSVDPVGAVQLRVINDTFAGADRWYSSHLELGGVGALPVGLEGLHVFVRGGQVMYTSRNIQRVEPPTRDHPFGAWLYADLGSILRRPRGLAFVRLRMGALGDGAFAEPVQDAMHALLGVRRPQGWPNQIADDFGWAIAAGGGGFARVPIRQWALVPAGLAVMDLGNVQRIVRAGASVGVLKGPGVAAVEHLDPAWATPPPGGGLAGGFLFGALLELRAYDRFVEGDGAPVEPAIDARPAVAQLRLGARVRWWRRRRSGRLARAGWVVGYTHAWRMRTFVNVPAEDLHPAWHFWGELEVRAFF